MNSPIFITAISLTVVQWNYYSHGKYCTPKEAFSAFNVLQNITEKKNFFLNNDFITVLKYLKLYIKYKQVYKCIYIHKKTTQYYTQHKSKLKYSLTTAQPNNK